MVFSGQCHCGAVTYKAEGAPVVVAQCHCEECRRLSGTGHTVGAMFLSANVMMTGKVNTYEYEAATGSTVSKATCAICASPVYGRNTRLPDHLTLTLGSMEEAEGLDVQVVIFERDKPHWDRLQDHVMAFETQPDWVPQG